MTETTKATVKPLSRTRDERIAERIRKHLADAEILCIELESRGYTLKALMGGGASTLVIDYEITAQREL